MDVGAGNDVTPKLTAVWQTEMLIIKINKLFPHLLIHWTAILDFEVGVVVVPPGFWFRTLTWRGVPVKGEQFHQAQGPTGGNFANVLKGEVATSQK